jgi:hypothetical protein
MITHQKIKVGTRASAHVDNVFVRLTRFFFSITHRLVSPGVTSRYPSRHGPFHSFCTRLPTRTYIPPTSHLLRATCFDKKVIGIFYDGRLQCYICEWERRGTRLIFLFRRGRSKHDAIEGEAFSVWFAPRVVLLAARDEGAPGSWLA